MKRLTALLTALLLAVLLVSGAAEPADTPEPEKADPAVQGEEVTVAESGNLRLSVNLSTCAVALWNGADGSRWDTNPVDPQEDAYTGGAVLNDIRSQLVVTYYDHQKNTATIGSYLASVLRRSFEIRKITDGVRVTYNFSRETEQFSIPLEYRLRDGALDIRIPVKDIKERGEARISEIQVLPYFLRGGNGEEGYLLIPDGSGALIDFSVPRPHAAPYKQKVYGRDLATSYYYDEGDKQAARLPVFGVSRGGSGLLAVISGNESAAYVEANPVGAVSSMANAFASFTYRQTDTALIAGKDWNYNEYPVVNDRAATRDFALCILPLEAGRAAYGDMAARYRDYLIKAGALTPLREDERLDGGVEFFGKTTERRSFLGIPYDHAVTATSFDEAAAILNELQETGSRLGAFLYGFGKGGYPGKESWNSAVGGRKGYDRLLASQKGTGGVIYGVQEFLYETDPAFLWLRQKNFARALNRDYLMKTAYSLSTYAAVTEGGGRYGLTAADLTKRLGRFFDKTPSRGGAGTSLGSIGTDLYSDYAEGSYTERQAMLESVRATLEKEDGRALAAEGGNAWLLGTVRTLYEIPTVSSRFDCAAESVPFYTMALHGYVNLAAVPFNAEEDVETAFLQCLEAGALPNFRITAKGNTVLKDTGYAFLYNTGYAGVGERLGEMLKASAALYDGLFDQPIIGHVRRGDVAVTTYANGARIAVNYGAEPADADGVTVPARGFIRIEGTGESV